METIPEYFVQVFCAQDVGQDGLGRQDWCDCIFDRRRDITQSLSRLIRLQKLLASTGGKELSIGFASKFDF